MRITPLTHGVVRIAIAALVVAVAATTKVNAQQGATYEVVSSFDIAFLNGSEPSSLRQADAGTFFGTTLSGGTFGKGTLFRMDAAGVVTLLHHFSAKTDGGLPFGLVRASDGRLYGLTSLGGEFGFGTVFTITAAGLPTTVHAFSATDSLPADLFASSDGNVYGLTAGGGDFGNGTIFVIDPAGGFRTIHSIPLAAGSGVTSLVRGSDSRFYATAKEGGEEGGGTLFAIDDAGTLTILHDFGPLLPPKGLMQARDGKLYGTTGSGGGLDGTVYSIDLAGEFSSLHTFTAVIDGRGPETDLVEASDGNLYGVTDFAGKLFRVDLAGTVTTLLDLPGSSPRDLIQGTDGRLYGTTGGGQTIVAIDLQATTLATLHQFTAGKSVGAPNGVILARNGQLYGTTQLSGAPSLVTSGTLFAIDATGARTTLHTFGGFQTDGTPMSNLFEGADGNFYGTTFNQAGPLVPPGQIFRVSATGDFTMLSSAHFLRAGVIEARGGRLYGTSSGGLRNLLRFYGDVFRVEANGTRTVLHQFDGIESGNPVAELVEIDDGSLYGTSAGGPFPTQTGPSPPGAIFRLDPVTGSFDIRHRFLDGRSPTGRLIQGTDGLIYGTTENGGAFGFGTVFSLDGAGTLTTLHHFAGHDGANPAAGVIQGLDGRLYGVTRDGGASGYGTVFVMSVFGGLTTLRHLEWADGAHPDTELTQASDGAFYGTASAGGPTGGGAVFRLRLALSPPGGDFEIVSRNSGKCLDIFGASTDAGAPAIQWTCHGGPNQQWRLEPAGGGAFRIIARHSGQALDVFGALVDDITPIIQWPVHGGDNQAWTLEPTSGGYVRIVARHSGKALDVEFASTDDGARVIQFTPHGGANQEWLLRGP